MNMLLTAEARPRIASGVRVSISVLRTTTLTLSNAPSAISATSDRMNERERPKTMVAIPKPATAQSSVWPERLSGGRWACASAIAKAPTEGAARSSPNPAAPTCRMVKAKIGSNVVAPPSNTAKRSSVIAARMIFDCQMKLTPATSERAVTTSRARGAGRLRISASRPTKASAAMASST